MQSVTTSAGMGLMVYKQHVEQYLLECKNLLNKKKFLFFYPVVESGLHYIRKAA
jgi:hypothetical protein